jgi:Ca2+-binding RTX toxin-like protein
VINSVIAGNGVSRGSSGAGILNGGSLTVSNSTVVGNSVLGNFFGGSAFGGGISGGATLQNSIIARNFAGSNPDVSGNFVDNGFNLIGNGTGSTGFANTSLVGTSANPIDPQLNGLIPLLGSPVIDAGSNSLIPADITDLDGDGNTTEPIPFDQRGTGFPRVFNNRVDIGAIEFTPSNFFNTIDGTGRDILTGTANRDRITGGFGGDTLTGGAGADEFVYASIRDAGDRITDFTTGSDQIVLTQLLDSLVTGGYSGTNAIADGYVRVIGQGSDAIVQIDQDGVGSSATFRSFITVQNVAATAMNNSSNFVF